LDYAQARYHSSKQGRFTSIDPLSASARLSDPQTLNRYSYVGNNPMVFSDPSGMSAYAAMRSVPGQAGQAYAQQLAASEVDGAMADYEYRLGHAVEETSKADSLSDGTESAQGKATAANNDSVGKAAPQDTAPQGTLTITDNIQQHRALDIDPQCGSSSGGGCTTNVRASLTVSSPISDSTDVRAISANLRIDGDMWIYNGPFPYRGRRPVDRSVVDARTARDHEYNAHVNVATAAVTPIINEFLGRTFRSQQEFQAAIRQLSTRVSALFRSTLRETQDRENGRR
jgi:hypothetical protein